MYIVTSFGFHYDHPQQEFFNVEGFKIKSKLPPNTVEIQFYGQYFCATEDALTASWAGRAILFRHFYWMPLLRTIFEASWSLITCHEVEPSKQVFRLKDDKEGYWIEGSCGIKVIKEELEGCLEGRMLLVEKHGTWKGFWVDICRGVALGLCG